MKQGVVSLQTVSDVTFAPVNNFCEATNPFISAIVGGGALLALNNLSDVNSVAISRFNLGQGQPLGLASLDLNTKVPLSQIYPPKQPFGMLHRFVVNTTAYSNVLYFPLIASEFTGQTTLSIILHTTIVNRNIDYQLVDEIAPSTLATGTINTSGIQTISLTTPVVNSLLNLSIKKNTAGGVNPIIKGLYLLFNL
jgi:hypothetical protein